jgi:hypothetical protein
MILLHAVFTAYRKTPEAEEILKNLEKDAKKKRFCAHTLSALRLATFER